MIAQTCSGANVAGAPERGASVSRNTMGACVGPANQRARQMRTVLGQTSSWRAISRTEVPAAERKIISARSAKLRGVFCARTRRRSSDSSSGARAIGAAERRGMARLRAIRGKAKRFLPFSRRPDSPKMRMPTKSEADFAHLWRIGLTSRFPSKKRSRHFRRGVLC